MKKLIFTLALFLFPLSFSQTSVLAQNSGERYVACLGIDCAIIGNEFCGYAIYNREDGTAQMYWCVIWVVEGDAPPEQA